MPSFEEGKPGEEGENYIDDLPAMVVEISKPEDADDKKLPPPHSLPA